MLGLPDWDGAGVCGWLGLGLAETWERAGRSWKWGAVRRGGDPELVLFRGRQSRRRSEVRAEWAEESLG